MSYKRKELLTLREHLGLPQVFVGSCCSSFCLSSFCVLRTICCQFLWIVHSWLPLSTTRVHVLAPPILEVTFHRYLVIPLIIVLEVQRFLFENAASRQVRFFVHLKNWSQNPPTLPLWDITDINSFCARYCCLWLCNFRSRFTEIITGQENAGVEDTHLVFRTH